MPNEPPSQVSNRDSRSNSASDRNVIKVVTTAGPQCVDKEFLNQLLSRKDVIPARKRRDFIPNDLKDDHYWERRRKNNLAAKRSREKRRLNDMVLGKSPSLSLSFHLDRFDIRRASLAETKVVELSNENEALKAKLHLMLSRVNMKENEMEHLFEEEQRLGHICLKPATLATMMHGQHSGMSDDDDNSVRSIPMKNSSSSETNDDDDHSRVHNQTSTSNAAVDLTRTEVKTGNLLARKSPSPLTPSPSPPNESLLQILANQMFKSRQQESEPSVPTSRLLTIATPAVPTHKRNLHQLQQDDDQQQKWDDAAMALLSLNKPPTPVEQQTALQSVCQSVINGLLRKPKATIDYHSSAHPASMQGENFHHPHQDSITSLAQWKTLMNYLSAHPTSAMAIPPSQPPSTQTININAPVQESRGDMMPLKLRMKMLHAKS